MAQCPRELFAGDRNLTGEVSGSRAPAWAEARPAIAAWAERRGLAFHHNPESGCGAVFSPCGSWRYLLWRTGNPRGKLLGMGLLNPSTADHTADDPTIRRCRARAVQAGMPALLVGLECIAGRWRNHGRRLALRRRFAYIGPCLARGEISGPRFSGGPGVLRRWRGILRLPRHRTRSAQVCRRSCWPGQRRGH